MNNYSIQFRFRGKLKYNIKKLIYDVDKKCRIFNTKKRRPVPHISLIVSLKLKNEKKLISDFYNLCKNTDLMRFEINGFDVFEENNVLYLKIIPGDKLKKFRWNLSKKLRSYCTLKPIDYDKKYNFHATIAMNLSDYKFKQVKNYISKKSSMRLEHIVARITLLKNRQILREYDFLQRKMFNRKLAKNKRIYNKTMNLLNNSLRGGLQINSVVKEKKRSNLFNWIRSLFK
jgi:hypothetical protein